MRRVCHIVRLDRVASHKYRKSNRPTYTIPDMVLCLDPGRLLRVIIVGRHGGWWTSDGSGGGECWAVVLQRRLASYSSSSHSITLNHERWSYSNSSCFNKLLKGCTPFITEARPLAMVNRHRHNQHPYDYHHSQCFASRASADRRSAVSRPSVLSIAEGGERVKDTSRGERARALS